WESRVTQYERDFERISTVVRKEVIRFEKEKSKDFKNHVIKYLETLLYSQQQAGEQLGIRSGILLTKKLPR
ncbi:SNX1 isoform 3, partial [Pan troglodytes]